MNGVDSGRETAPIPHQIPIADRGTGYTLVGTLTSDILWFPWSASSLVLAFSSDGALNHRP